MTKLIEIKNMLLFLIKKRKPNYLLFKKRIRQASGIEFAFIYVILLQITATFFAILIFYQKEIEANSLSKDIASSIIFDPTYANQYAELGQTANSEEEFLSTIKNFLLHTKEIAQQYGDIIFIPYLMEDDRYIIGKNFDLDGKPIAIDKTLVNVIAIENSNGTNIPAGTGIILNDNALWYLNDENELQKDTRFDFKSHIDAFSNIDNNYNINTPTKQLITYFDFDSNSERNVYFLPYMNFKLIDNISYYDLFDRGKSLTDLFETITPNLYDTTKRNVIDKEKTMEVVKNLIDNYNTTLKYKDRAFSVDFADFKDITGTVQDDNKQSVLSNYKKNTTSFFFYGDELKGRKENYGYRIRDYRDIELDYDKYYPYLANSLRLELKTKVYLPIISIEAPIHFGYDLTIIKNKKSLKEE